MFCPDCGAELAQAFSFCKHCGANLSIVEKSAGLKSPTTTVDTVMWVIVGTTITLLGMGLGAMVLMTDGAIDAGLGKVFVLLSFAALLLVESVLVWRLRQLNRGSSESRTSREQQEPVTRELEANRVPSLTEPAEPVPEATERPTRAFEPLYRKDRDD